MTPTFMPHQTDVLNQTQAFNRVAYYLDMGLGKTFVGAEKVWELNNNVNLVLRFEWLAFEIDPEYYQKADQRIKAEQAQLSIFDFFGGDTE